jgi:sugar phosphate isomerase/epimerase
MMRFAASIHAVTQFGNDIVPFSRALDIIADCGFDSIMLLATPSGPRLDDQGDAPGSLIDVRGSDPTVLGRALRARGLGLALIREACMSVSDQQSMKQSAERLARLADFCAELDCDVGCNCGASPQPMLPHADKRDAITRLAEAVNLAMSGRSQRLAIDVHHHGILETLEDCDVFLGLLQQVNGGILLNIGHMTTCGQEGWRACERWPEQVPVVAWKDHVVSPLGPAVRSTELGLGHSPFARYVEGALSHPDRTHLIAFEDIPLEQKPAALRRSADYLRRLLQITS